MNVCKTKKAKATNYTPLGYFCSNFLFMAIGGSLVGLFIMTLLAMGGR